MYITRVALKKSAEHKIYNIEEIDKIELPYKDVRSFFQEKWKVSGDKAGSGNTTNIGSIRGSIEEFRDGKGPFDSEEEFLDYWRNYERTDDERKTKFSDIKGFRAWRG